MGHSSCQDLAPAWALHRLQLSAEYVHLLWPGVLHRLQSGYLLWSGPSWAAEKSFFTAVFSMSCRGNICSSAWNTYCPPSSLIFCSAVSHFSHSSFSQLLCSIFYPFLNISPQRHHLLHWVAQLWPTVHLFYSWLEPAVFSPGWDWSWGAAPCPLSQRPPVLSSPPPNLAIKMQYTM